MYKIIRRVIDVSNDDNEKILSETCREYEDLTTAMFEFGKARKADRAMYRIALSKVENKNYIAIEG